MPLDPASMTPGRLRSLSLLTPAGIVATHGVQIEDVTAAIAVLGDAIQPEIWIDNTPHFGPVDVERITTAISEL